MNVKVQRCKEIPKAEAFRRYPGTVPALWVPVLWVMALNDILVSLLDLQRPVEVHKSYRIKRDTSSIEVTHGRDPKIWDHFRTSRDHQLINIII